jgi:hypothetical protein
LKATRSNLPHLIAAAGGAVLILALFLSWISIGDASASGWETFSLVDIVLFVIGVVAVAVGGAYATGAALPVPWLRPNLLKWLGVIAVTIVLTFIVEGDNLGFGAFIGLLGALAILAGGILAERPDLAARVADATGVSDERPAAQPPSGLGGGTASTTTPGAGAPPSGAPVAGGPAAGGGSEAATSVQPTTSAGGAAPAAAGAGPGGESSGPPAGWYPDPQGQARLRYWDGGTWTDQTSA